MTALAAGSTPVCRRRLPSTRSATTPTSFSDLETAVTGNTVTLDAGYDTPTYTVGASGDATVNLQTGDVIQDGTTLYRYTAPAKAIFSLTDANIKGAGYRIFVTVGGTAGDTLYLHRPWARTRAISPTPTIPTCCKLETGGEQFYGAGVRATRRSRTRRR